MNEPDFKVFYVCSRCGRKYEISGHTKNRCGCGSVLIKKAVLTTQATA